VALRLFLRQPDRFDILSRRVPALGRQGFGGEGEGERAAREAIARRLGALNAAIGDFRAGLELLDHAETHGACERSWGPIACRDAAMALLRFRAALKAIGEALKGVKPVRGTRARLKSVERRFAADFPIARAGRAGARAGGGGGPPRRHNDICDAVIAAHVSRAGRIVTHLGNGKALRFELSEPSLWRLVVLRDAAFAVFEDT
jgi:hypothetical protein